MKLFTRKASVTLGPIYCSQDEGNGLFYSIPFCNLWGTPSFVAAGGTCTVQAAFKDQGREELGHQDIGKPAVDVNHRAGVANSQAPRGQREQRRVVGPVAERRLVHRHSCRYSS